MPVDIIDKFLDLRILVIEGGQSKYGVLTHGWRDPLPGMYATLQENWRIAFVVASTFANLQIIYKLRPFFFALNYLSAFRQMNDEYFNAIKGGVRKSKKFFEDDFNLININRPTYIWFANNFQLWYLSSHFLSDLHPIIYLKILILKFLK